MKLLRCSFFPPLCSEAKPDKTLGTHLYPYKRIPIPFVMSGFPVTKKVSVNINLVTSLFNKHANGIAPETTNTVTITAPE